MAVPRVSHDHFHPNHISHPVIRHQIVSHITSLNDQETFLTPLSLKDIIATGSSCPVHAMMGYRGKSSIARCPASRPGRFTLREEPQNPLYKGMYGRNRLCEKCGEEKNLLPLHGSEAQIIHPIAWSLHQLSYLSSRISVYKAISHIITVALLFLIRLH